MLFQVLSELSWELSGQLSGGWGSATPGRATTRATRGSPEAKSLPKYCNLQYKSPRATISLSKFEGWRQKVFQSIAFYNTRARKRPFRLANLTARITIVCYLQRISRARLPAHGPRRLHRPALKDRQKPYSVRTVWV